MVERESTYPYLVGPIGILAIVGLLLFFIPENNEYVDWKAEVVSTAANELIVRRLGSDQTANVSDSRATELKPGQCVLVRQNVGFSLLKKSEFILERSVPCK